MEYSDGGKSELFAAYEVLSLTSFIRIHRRKWLGRVLKMDDSSVVKGYTKEHQAKYDLEEGLSTVGKTTS